MLPILQRPARPLPRTVTPVQNETISSYLHRLAVANRLDDEALRTYLTGSTRKRDPVTAESLALLSGRPIYALRYAILELCNDTELAAMRTTGRPRPGGASRPHCRRCAASRGIQGHAEIWITHDDLVCHHHRCWLAGRAGAEQPDLTHQPDILRAHRRHQRLIRRHGRDRARSAFHAASLICAQWADRSLHDHDFQRLMAAFHGPRWRVPTDAPTIGASRYPQVIALTRLLASPYWTSLAFQITCDRLPFVHVLETGPGLHRFVAEVQRTVAPRFTWSSIPSYGRYEPLSQWLIDEIQAIQVREELKIRYTVASELVDGKPTRQETASMPLVMSS